MKLLFSLNHPAHYFLFKFIIINLKEKGHQIKIVIKDKDILEKLMILEGVQYHKFFRIRNRKNNFVSIFSNLILEIFKQDLQMYNTCMHYNPDVLIGTDVSISHVGKLLGIKSLIYNEDDYEINKSFCLATYPFADKIISPTYTSVGSYEYKKISYNGIQKMSYLNPKYYRPDSTIKEIANIGPNEKYFIIRLVNLTAGHDIYENHKGINVVNLRKIIRKLKPHGKIFISSEDDLSKEFEKYKIKIPLNRMHDFMSFAEIFIGDSQTMCAEAGLLGTPFIRINDFVGKIQYLADIEENFEMGQGFRPSEINKALIFLEKLLHTSGIKLEWQEKSKRAFKEKTDIVEFSMNILDQLDNKSVHD